MKKLHICLMTCLCLLTFLLSAKVNAAELREITDFGPNPSELKMHLYVPDSAGPEAPLLLAVHYCTGSGPAYHQGKGFAALAEKYGFIVVYPSATREGHCFDVSSRAALTRDGGSDPVGIKSMLDYTLRVQDADPAEIYLTGISSGAMMTQVLLALYPEVFRAASAFAGVPFTCFATDNPSGWNNACADGKVLRSAAEWGDAVRRARPDYDGPYPRLQLWHGTGDDALQFPNFGEAIEQWTNVHGLDEGNAWIDTPRPGIERKRFYDSSGALLMEANRLEGVSHDLPIDMEAAIRFMGLDRKPVTPPTWRPFSDDSPWNTPIAADARTDPNSEQLIADFADRGALHINIREWSIPVYYVDSSSTPLHDVGDLRPGVYGRGFEPPRAVPIPDHATASLPVGGDEHLAIVDRETGMEWGMWWARQVDGRWMTGLGAVTDLRSRGVAPPWDRVDREYDAHRARASGFPLVAGLIRVEEILAGHIPHALVFAYDHVQTEHFIPPASTAQASTPSTRNNREGMPMGARIRLDPAFDIEASGLSRSGKIIARALQEYGAFLGDYAGGNVIYAESAPDALQSWKGLLNSSELEQVFSPQMMKAHFHLLDMGEVLRGQNYSP